MADQVMVRQTRGLFALARARQLKASNYGREFGWYIELDGVVVGELDYLRAEQFWATYRVRASSPESEAMAYDDACWFRVKYRYRKRVLDDYADELAYCGGPPFVQEGMVMMREPSLGPRSWFERFLLFFLA